MVQEAITSQGYKKLTEEIQFYKEIEIPNIIEDIKISASYGDLTENAEYEAAIERQSFILTKLAELQKMLTKLIIIDPSKSNHNKIAFGSTFEILNSDSDEKFIYTLVGSYESNPKKGLISYNSPLAKFFIGKEIDEEIKVTINNKLTYYDIEKIYFDANRIMIEKE
jgi:transcription elongation factor GreA